MPAGSATGTAHSHSRRLRRERRGQTIRTVMPTIAAAETIERVQDKREMLLAALSAAGFDFSEPEGAYYVMADVAPLGWKDDWKFLDFLARKVGVIGVPGSSFYVGGRGRTKMRFNFAKRESTLREAARRLEAWDLRAPGRRRRGEKRG